MHLNQPRWHNETLGMVFGHKVTGLHHTGPGWHGGPIETRQVLAELYRRVAAVGFVGDDTPGAHDAVEHQGGVGRASHDGDQCQQLQGQPPTPFHRA